MSRRLPTKPSSPGSQSSPRGYRGGWVALAIGALLVVVLGVVYAGWGSATQRAERAFQAALEEYRAGHIERAEQMAWSGWQLDPSRHDAALFAAQCAAAQGRFAEAAEYAQAVSPENAELYLAAQRLLAEAYHDHLARLGRAEAAYRAVLEMEPEDMAAHRGLARLLGLCGRRREAVPSVLHLVRRGAAEDLLMLLARENGVTGGPELLERAAAADPGDPLPLVGLAWHASDAGDSAEAIRLLRRAISLCPDFAAAHVALGRQYVEADQFPEVAQWNAHLPPSAEDFPEVWVVRGRAAEQAGQMAGAIRCYGEACVRDAALRRPVARLAQLLAAAGETSLSERFAQQSRDIQALESLQNRIFFSDEPSGIETLLQLVDRYRAVGRLWEAFGWCQLAVEIDPRHSQVRQTFTTLERRLRGAPLDLVFVGDGPIADLDLGKYPLPRLDAPQRSSPDKVRADALEFAFRDDAASAGIRFEFFNGTSGPPQRHMYEVTGGGIAVLDFDADGESDVYLTQGRKWPPDAVDTEHADALYRNLQGQQFSNVSHVIRALDNGFGQGVTVGDFNADGFSDLYVANIGQNRLLKNNGDGTFSDATGAAGLADHAWTTSCVLADLSGDGLADIYEANYVQGPDVFTRVCADARGNPQMCMPFDFDPQRDRYWINDGAGRFVDATSTHLSAPPDGKGLGLAVFDADDSGRLSLMVANDTTPNFWFAPVQSESGEVMLRERGIAAGVAFNDAGKAEGSMGIAVGDLDNDGYPDLMTTNFLNETNTFYLNQGGGTFVDRTRALGIDRPSLDKLGFGTQFLDADLDGTAELFVANGHIDDLRREGRPYEMQAQLFAFRQGRFVEVASGEIGPYFERGVLGRAVARLDWNQDGREDLLVGHLASPLALLSGTTAKVGHHVTLRLVGTASARDAVGATVSVTAGGRTHVRQLVAGDGYQASNERKLVIGLGAAERIDSLVVRWPAGTRDEFQQLEVDREYLIVEGRDVLSP